MLEKTQSEQLLELRAQLKELLVLLKESNKWRDVLRKNIDSLHKDLGSVRERLGQYECPSCGEKDIEEHRYIHPVSSDPVCFQCGNYWPHPPKQKDQESTC